jgi:3-dehydroquinate synthase
MPENRSFSFRFGGRASAVVIAAGFDPAYLRNLVGTSASLVVSDPNTLAYARSIAAAVGAAEPFVLAGGEAAKGWQAAEAVIGAARGAGLSRDGWFIGVGGGVVTDLTAFAASVYMRGARLALYPTTLLAMADAAVGGKTGFDLFGLKNLVGTFRPADAVFMAGTALAGLPVCEWLSGFAEVVKTAVIGDGGLLGLIEAQAGTLAAGPANPECAALVPELVARCVAVKGRIVEADPEETGTERALLNLGHTYGHALEAVAGLGVVAHGAAVAWGMARACALGRGLGLTPADRADRIVRLLGRYGYAVGPVHPALSAAPADAAGRLLAAMQGDKKRQDGRLRFVVPTADGAELCRAEDDRILKTLVERRP